MNDEKLSMGDRVVDWLNVQLREDFSESQASAITVALLYGIMFQDQLREFFHEHIKDIIDLAEQEGGEAPVD